jgi:hypothetical protein
MRSAANARSLNENTSGRLTPEFEQATGQRLRLDLSGPSKNDLLARDAEMKREENLEAVRASGNVFRDLGHENADTEQFKAILAAKITKRWTGNGSRCAPRMRVPASLRSQFLPHSQCRSRTIHG